MDPQQQSPQYTPPTPAAKENKAVEDITKTINIVLPGGNTPFVAKVIAFLTTIGGLSIVANLIADVVQPNAISLLFYLFRLVIGVAMIAVGYGILKQKGWVVWLYGGITLIGLAVNPVIVILPLAVTVYLYYQKVYFDAVFPLKAWRAVKDLIKRLRFMFTSQRAQPAQHEAPETPARPPAQDLPEEQEIVLDLNQVPPQRPPSNQL